MTYLGKGESSLSQVFYTPQKAWIALEANQLTVGLTREALMGDIVYIELPKPGQHLEKGKPCVTVESMKAAVEVCAPVSGTVTAINETVFDDPDTVTTKQAWLFKLDIDGKADTSGWVSD